MRPVLTGSNSLVDIDHGEDASEGMEEKMAEMKGEFYFNKGNFENLKNQIKGESHQKIILNGHLYTIKEKKLKPWLENS